MQGVGGKFLDFGEFLLLSAVASRSAVWLQNARQAGGVSNEELQ